MNYNTIRALRAMGMPEQLLKTSAVNYQTYNFTAAAGTTTQTLQIPGTAVVLLGIIVNEDTVAPDSYFNLKLNNETLAESLNQLQCASSSQAITPEGYFPFTRRMTGRDTLTVDYTSTAGSSVRFTIAYITNYNPAVRK